MGEVLTALGEGSAGGFLVYLSSIFLATSLVVGDSFELRDWASGGDVLPLGFALSRGVLMLDREGFLESGLNMAVESEGFGTIGLAPVGTPGGDLDCFLSRNSLKRRVCFLI